MESEKSAFEAIMANIEEAHRLTVSNESVKLAAVVSGSETDKVSWQRRLVRTGKQIFNSDGSTLVMSLEEKTGDKTREGNFLGTLLAYRYIQTLAHKAGIDHREHVSLIGMLFGRGERMSPVTQCKGCRKPGIEVTPSSEEMSLTAIEEALLYFTPVAKYLENNGFRGVLNKWGDETEIPSVGLLDHPGKDLFSEHDVVKFVSVMKITEELAGQKDWVLFDGDNGIICQISRGSRESIIDRIEKYGDGPCSGGKCYAGISLGPVAVSYNVLDIAMEVFSEEIEKKGVYFDFDPYFLMALSMKGADSDVWESGVRSDKKLRELVATVPDFFEKVQRIKSVFRERYGRDLTLKTVDLGSDVYWADIGQHSAMRDKYMSLNEKKHRGEIARKLAGIPSARDERGNIIVNSGIGPGIEVTGSVIVNSKLDGSGKVSGSVIIDSEFKDVNMTGAFSVKSTRYGKTVLEEKSGLFESIGCSDILLEPGMRHVSVLSEKYKYDLKVAESTDLRDKDNTYNVPIFNNDISFEEAYNKMLGVSIEELEKRRKGILERMKNAKNKYDNFKQLRFGTSGLRDEVKYMTDMECYINSSGFIRFLLKKGELKPGGKIAVGGDRRESTPRIIGAVSRAVRDAGCEVVFCGLVPSPTLANYAIMNGFPSIMVTGSHIPEGRNGIKFTKASGEVLKSDERDILDNVSVAREEVYSLNAEESLFDDNGMFKKAGSLPGISFEKEAEGLYIERYVDVFGPDALKDMKVVFYQHSAVGRDIVDGILEKLGAEVIRVGRSEKFVPVDTEKVSADTRRCLKEWASEYSPFAIVSTDGDSDRPLLADENGDFLPGDKLGALVSAYLKPDFAAIPISANDAVIKSLRKKNIEVEQTKIGSPYVIKAMNDKLAVDPDTGVVSWESNGGFLLGSDWDINGKSLRALPTRDAVLPVLSVLLLAKQEKKSISGIISEHLPARYTHADVVDDKTPGCERYTTDMGKAIIKEFSPGEIIKQADFTPDGVVVDGKGADENISAELNGIKDKLSAYFGQSDGFGDIRSINFIDGVRMVFSNDYVVHIRPSGNAPEFRVYATASSQEEADDIVGKRFSIIPRMVEDMESGTSFKSVGAMAAGENIPLMEDTGFLVESVNNGNPLFLRPYTEPKVWGVDGIGEYWYGAEKGEKSSVAVYGGRSARMSDLLEETPEKILGENVIKSFGRFLPLVKLLTPRDRLSIQFHDSKNELWIVTGITHSYAGNTPSIILGFSTEAVKEYGDSVNSEYGKALEGYGRALNGLIDIMESKGYGEDLMKRGNAMALAEEMRGKDSDITGALEELIKAREAVEFFYCYREVKVGDVIPVPSGTLHALGSGIEVVEPQIAGPTQSLEDGATYPVRYYFPGYEKDGAKKPLDLDRVNEIIPGVAEDTLPDIISDEKDVKVERLPGKFEDKGLEVHRITIKPCVKKEFKDIKSFHNLVLVEGKAVAIVNGQEYDIPRAETNGEMLFIPASAGEYTIVAKDDSQIIDTFTPA